MSTMGKLVSKETIDRAKRMREAEPGISWRELGRRLGHSGAALKERCEGNGMTRAERDMLAAAKRHGIPFEEYKAKKAAGMKYLADSKRWTHT